MENSTVIIRHEVKDFATWRSVFDAAKPMREEGGEIKADVYRAGNTVHAVIEYASLDQAKTHFGSPLLKEKMGEAGVIGVPEISFVEPA
jgi:hypothetical protein